MKKTITIVTLILLALGLTGLYLKNYQSESSFEEEEISIFEPLFKRTFFSE